MSIKPNISPGINFYLFVGALSMHFSFVLPQDQSNEIFEFKTLVTLTARCLSLCDEGFGSYQFQKKPCLSRHEITKSFDLFLQKFDTKETLEYLPKLLSKLPHGDFQCPYVTKIDANDGSIVCFIGDLHGSLHSLLRSLWRLVALGYLDKNFRIISENFYLIFLGDYVDRGRYGIEVLYTLMRLKCASWNQVYLVRGNHEVASMNEAPVYYGGGFWHELEAKYQACAAELFAKIDNVYQRLPLAVYLAANNQVVQAAHAGFGPYDYYYDKGMQEFIAQKEKRYCAIALQDTDIMAPAFQWCDISQQLHAGLPNNFIRSHERVWSIDIPTLITRLAQGNLKALFRGHQHGSYGLKMLFTPEEYLKLINNDNGLDPDSSHYHWLNVLRANDLNENKKQGFNIGRYVPLFTFSSATEGVGEKFDCFGLLLLKNLFEKWLLKVYEFASPMTQKNKGGLPLGAFYTTISSARQDKPKFGTAGVLDPIDVIFKNHSENEETLIQFLNSIEAPIGE
jgi:hypothetical protein